MVCLTFLFLGRDANKMKEEYIDLENQWIKKTGKVRSCSLLLCTQLTCRSILFSNVHQKRADVTLVALREVLGSGCLQQGSGTNKRSHEEVEGSKVTVVTALSNVPLRPELTIICFTIILHEEGGDRGEQESKPTQNQTYLYLLAKLVNHFLFCCTPIIRQRQQRIRYSSSTTFIFDTFYEPESNDLFLLPFCHCRRRRLQKRRCVWRGYFEAGISSCIFFATAKDLWSVLLLSFRRRRPQTKRCVWWGYYLARLTSYLAFFAFQISSSPSCASCTRRRRQKGKGPGRKRYAHVHAYVTVLMKHTHTHY